MNYITITIKTSEELNEVEISTLQDMFMKDEISIREIIDELLDKHDQLTSQTECEDSEDLRRIAYEDEQREEREVQMHYGN